MDGGDELNEPVRRVGDATDQVAGAWPLSAGIGGDPVGARAEVVALAANVDGPQRVVGCGVGQRPDEFVDHRMAQRVASGRTIECEPQDRAVPSRSHHTVSGGDLLTHRRVPSRAVYGYPYSMVNHYYPIQDRKESRMADGDSARFGEQPLAQTVAAASALRRLAGQLLSLEHPHPVVDAVIGQIGAWEGELAGAVAPDATPRIGADGADS